MQKEKFLREVRKHASPVNTKMMCGEGTKKQENSLIVDVEQVLVVWVKDQNTPPHSHKLKPDPARGPGVSFQGGLTGVRREAVEEQV